MSAPERVMSPEERDRLSKAEQILAGQKETLDQIRDAVDRLQSAVNRLEALANMGRGALGMFLKAGAAVTVIVGALAWAYDRFLHRGPS